MFFEARRRTNALLVALLLAVLCADALVWAHRASPEAEAAALDRATLLDPRPAPPPADPPAGPIAIPENPYAPEPVVRIGTISIPKLGLVHDLYEGVTLTVIDHGPSHWPGTAMPGQPGNAVVAGHRVTHDHPFLDIDQLKPGDTVSFDVAGVHSTYRVTGSQIVTPDAVWIADQTPTATATLYACHPKYSKRLRYVVHLVLA